ncbi:HDOD domain-containing protein [Hydrogenophaga aquatica]
MQLEDLLKQPQAFPVVPEVAARLIQTFEDEDIDLEGIAGEIQKDPVLSAQVLRQANSSFFRLMRPVATVRDAVAVIGLNKIRALVISAALNQSFHAVSGVPLERFWQYSLAAAQVARHICVSTHLDENIAFTTGLLHGMGELVMHAGMPEHMAAFDALCPMFSVARAELQYTNFGYSHAEVGAELARRWRLPKAMSHAIGAQNRPLEGDVAPLAAVLHLAVWRAQLFLQGDEPDVLIHTYPDAVGLLLELDPDVLVMPGIAPLRDLPAL